MEFKLVGYKNALNLYEYIFIFSIASAVWYVRTIENVSYLLREREEQSSPITR